MDSILVKIFATALTLSQVTTAPDAVTTRFDPVTDQAKVVQSLRDGCLHMRRAFDIEDINIDELLSTAMADPQAVTGDIKVLRGIRFSDLNDAYRQFCKNETLAKPVVDIGEVIAFYNQSLADLPDHARLKGQTLPGMSTITDAKGAPFAEMFAPDQRRITVPLSAIPAHVQQAFIAAEDKRFFDHKGIDERALVRAFIGNLASPGRPQGGSTITQQLAKNLLTGDDLSYVRKIREMVLASRLEHTLTKPEILGLYLNQVYLGRGAWGVELAARAYFNKSVGDLTPAEGALLAGLTKGPGYFNPDRHPERARERYAYVIARMKEEGVLTPEAARQALTALPDMVPYERVRRDTGFHFVDQVAREAKAVAGVATLTGQSYTVKSTLNLALQRATETALQEGLAHYERSVGRARLEAPEANLTAAIKKVTEQAKAALRTPNATRSEADLTPPWQTALSNARLPLYDVHWQPAIVLERGTKGGLRVGLSDGRIVPLSTAGVTLVHKLAINDVVYVELNQGRDAAAARAELRARPTVQGAVVVLENRTGRVLAMAGGFSYPLSQLNRTIQSARQPGSSFKPVSYLAALRAGLQPNTLVRDEPITLGPVGGSAILAERSEDIWNPRNADGGIGGVITLRRALENSRNLATANLLEGGIDLFPEASLDRVCEVAKEAQIYRTCVRFYPFVLGAQPARPIDMAAFYASIANEGTRPSPYLIETIAQGDKVVYQHAAPPPAPVSADDRAAYFQLRTMLQGVLSRGTARSIAALAPYIGGKTGTSDEANDAWFVGFTNDVTVAVWVGYDNAAGRRTLGGRETGAKVALPIFEPVIKATWSLVAPRTALRPASPEAAKRLAAVPIDLRSGSPVQTSSAQAFTEYLRRDRSGEVLDAQYRLVSKDTLYAYGTNDDLLYNNGNPSFFLFGNNDPLFAPDRPRGLFAPRFQQTPVDPRDPSTYEYDDTGRYMVPRRQRPPSRADAAPEPPQPVPGYRNSPYNNAPYGTSPYGAPPGQRPVRRSDPDSPYQRRWF